MKTQPTPYDSELERLSDRVRRGQPIGLLQALAVIEYQQGRCKVKWWRRALEWLNRWHRAAKGSTNERIASMGNFRGRCSARPWAGAGELDCLREAEMTRPSDSSIARAIWAEYENCIDGSVDPDVVIDRATDFDADMSKSAPEVTTPPERVQIPAESKRVCSRPTCRAEMRPGLHCGGPNCPLRK